MLKLPHLVYIAPISARVPNLITSTSILYMCFMRKDTHNDNNREETEPTTTIITPLRVGKVNGATPRRIIGVGAHLPVFGR